MKNLLLAATCGGLVMLSQAVWPQSEPSGAEIKSALTEWLKSGSDEYDQAMESRSNKKMKKLCNVMAYMVLESYEIKEKNVSDDKAIYKLKPKYVFTKDLKDIAAETNCDNGRIAASIITEHYGVVEKGKVADGSSIRGYWNAILTMGKFKNGWKMMSYS